MQELFSPRDSKSEGKILATIIAGPSPPPVVVETVRHLCVRSEVRDREVGIVSSLQ